MNIFIYRFKSSSNFLFYYYVSERRYGSFKRSFRLPAEVEAGKITAEMEKGVLSITLPKSASAKRKQQKIEIAAKKK